MKGKSIYHWFGFNIPMDERFRMIRDAGFNSIFIWWGDEFAGIDGPKERLPELASKAGLRIENVHLPFFKANDLWLDCAGADAMMQMYLKSITDCSNYGISTAVLHLTTGMQPPEPGPGGVERIKRLVAHAEDKEINIAVENVEKISCLDRAFAEIPSVRLGFCYDSGHEAVCGIKTGALLEKYGGRLMALHLHDNDGLTDRHMIPGEGRINWSIVKNAVMKTGYCGPVSLEVTNEYSDLKGKESAEEFLKRAYDAAAGFEE